MSEIPKIVSSDGVIEEKERINEDKLNILTRVRVSDYIRGSLAEKKPFGFAIRSGNAQLGIDLNNLGEAEQEGENVFLSQEIVNLNPVLHNVLENFQKGDEVGRIFVMDPELRINDLYHFLHKRIFIETPFVVKTEKDVLTGKECNFVEVSLLPQQYVFESDALSPVSINRVIKDGRIALDKIRSELPIDLALTFLKPNELFIGAIKISLGDVVAIIDPVVEPNEAEVKHLPATILDPFRTSRKRQVELFNNGKKEVPLMDLKVRIRFFKAQNPLSVPLNKDKIQKGYRLADLIPAPKLGSLFNVFDALKSPEHELNQKVLEGKSLHGIILNKGKIMPVPQALNPNGAAQVEIIKTRAAMSMSDIQPKNEILTNLELDDQKDLQQILKNLSVMGGRNSKLWLSNEFPDKTIIESLRSRGIRTFLSDHTELFLSDEFFKTMLDLTHAEESPCEFLRFDRDVQKLLTFYHGFFMEPEDKERFDKVRYWFAFYGSHTDKIDEGMVMSFLSQSADILNGSMGIIHGSGPGLMKNANNLARLQNVFSLGVGIDLAYKEQSILTSCDGFTAFPSGERHARQHLMEKITSFPIINIGGYGTLEELAITTTSLKLHENPLGPVIFLDPNNMWEEARKMSLKIAEEGLGQAYIPKLYTPVRTAEEGIRCIVDFVSNPDAWYKKKGIPQEAVLEAREKAAEIRFNTLRLKNSELFQEGFK